MVNTKKSKKKSKKKLRHVPEGIIRGTNIRSAFSPIRKY